MQSDTKQLRARAILEADLLCLGQLRDILLEERAALGRRDSARLDLAVQNKLACLQALEGNEAKRKQLLAEQRGGDWPELLTSLDPGLAEQWKLALPRLREVEELGLANERIVNRTRLSVGRLLALLRGQFEPVGIYDRSGRTLAYGDNRPITRA